MQSLFTALQRHQPLLRRPGGSAPLAAAFAALILAGIAAMGSGRPAAAADEEAVDCGSTPFAFSGQGFFVDCLRFSNRAAKDGASGETQSDLISITSGERSMFLTVVSVRLTATRLYLRRQDLRENTRDFFSNVELNDWNGIGNKNGYDMAEFTSEVSGQPSRCIALQRYLNPIETGYKRHVIGIGCAAGGLDVVYDALTKLQAPGD